MSTKDAKQILDEKDAEIQRLKALLAQSNTVATTGTTEEQWVHLETRLSTPSTVDGEDEINEVFQPYEVILNGENSLGFQLARAFVAVRRKSDSEQGTLSKIVSFGTDAFTGSNAALAAPFILQERAIVLKVEPGGIAMKAGIVVGSTLRALNGKSVLNLTYTAILQNLRNELFDNHFTILI